MASFTHYWTGSTCGLHEGLDGEPLNHTAGNLFRARGVAPADKIYVVNVLRGDLYLIARMQVAKLTSQADAERYFGEEVWVASEHLIATKGSGTPMRFRRMVPHNVAGELLFESADKYEGLKYEAPGALDRQTLRGVRRLTDSSALLLDRFMKEAP